MSRSVVDRVQGDVQHRSARLPPRQLQLDRLHRPLCLPLLIRPPLPRRHQHQEGRQALQRHGAGAGGAAAGQRVAVQREEGEDVL